MSATRQRPSKTIDDFDLSWNTINNICNHNTHNVLYNRYIENSLKASKRDKRSYKDRLKIMNTKLQSSIPEEVERFGHLTEAKNLFKHFHRSFSEKKL